MDNDAAAGRSQTIKRSVAVARSVLFQSKRFVRRLVERKGVDALESESHTDRQLRPNVLSLGQLIAIGLGCTIGTGIFVLSGQASARYAGPSIIISFIVSGVVALLSALSYAEMASMLSTSGSAYTYVYIALGEYPAFLVGWTSGLLYQLAASVVAVRWSHYVVHFIELISDRNITKSIVEAPIAWSKTSDSFYVTGQVINVPSIAIGIFITVILFLGIRETAMVNLVLVVFKIIILLIFIFAGCVYVDTDNYRPFFPKNEGGFSAYGVTGMLKASTFVFFAYVGFETVSTVTKEAKERSKYIPYATITSLVITMVLYVAVCTVMVGLIPYTMLDQVYPLQEAIKRTPYGMWLAVLLDLGAIASITTVGIAVLLAQTRVVYAMALDRLLPGCFARIHQGRKTPWLATVICGLICVIMSGVCPVDILGEVAAIGALTTFFLVHVSVIVMRYTHDFMPRPFRIPLGPFVIPILGALFCILLLINVTRGTGIRYGIWMAIGHVVYFSYGFWYSKAHREKLKESRVSLEDLVTSPQAHAVDLEDQQSTSSTIEPPTVEQPIETRF